jgi:hypothetical protein
LSFDLAYNQTAGILLDIYDSYLQKVNLQEKPSFFWRIIANLTIPPEPAEQVILEEFSQIDLNSYVNQDDLDKHLAQYRAEFSKGHVVVIGHSQGNLYANQAYNRLSLTEKGRFGIVAVATPSSSVAGYASGEEPYTTLKEDRIIALVRSIFPSTLEPKTSNGSGPPCGNDSLCHNFIGTYLAGINSDSELHIMLNIVGAISRFSTPPPESGSEAWQEDFEGTVSIVMNSSTCHQDPQQYGYMSFASIVSGVAISR